MLRHFQEFDKLLQFSRPNRLSAIELDPGAGPESRSSDLGNPSNPAVWRLHATYFASDKPANQLRQAAQISNHSLQEPA